MKPSNPWFWAALQIHKRLIELQADDTNRGCRPLEPLWELGDSLRQGWKQLQLAQRRGWALSAQRLMQSLHVELERLHRQAQAALARWPGPLPPPPTLPGLRDDLAQLRCEFQTPEVRPREGVIAVATEPIVLQDVFLGPFEIQLHLHRLARGAGVGAFDVVALDPHPATNNADVTHPHVQGRSLCAGDATVPIAWALCQGRITEAFLLIRSVLGTYNPHSPYVSLEDWSGVPCSDCGSVVQEDDRYGCGFCGGDFCDRCISCCEDCRESACRGCLDEDPDSGEQLCRRCREAREVTRAQEAANETAGASVTSTGV